MKHTGYDPPAQRRCQLGNSLGFSFLAAVRRIKAQGPQISLSTLVLGDKERRRFTVDRNQAGGSASHTHSVPPRRTEHHPDRRASERRQAYRLCMMCYCVGMLRLCW